MRIGKVKSNNFADSEGRPTGGTTFGPGFAIGWQNGPLGRDENRIEQNGAFVEDVIVACLERIEFYQASQFKSEFNERAHGHLIKALGALDERTQAREARGVEGTWTK